MSAESPSIDWLFTTPEGRTPEFEVREILGDLAARLPTEIPVVPLWQAFAARTPDPDAMAAERMDGAGFFAEGRTIGGEDAGHCIVLAVAYCAKARAAWIDGEPAGAWSNVVAAARWHGAFQAIFIVGQHHGAAAKAVRSAAGKAARMAKLSADPKQIAKMEIKAWWNDGKAIGPGCPNGAAFDRQAVAKYPVLATGTELVKRWRGQWRKAKRPGG